MAFRSLERQAKKKGFRTVAGVDEAGRGPWAGPVVAVCVILPRGLKLPNLRNSKKLSAKKREELFGILKKRASVGIGSASAKEIDRKGLLWATERAMQRAFFACQKHSQEKIRYVLVDGRDGFSFPVISRDVIRGDESVRSIMAASIIAKVHRDRLVQRLEKKYPGYALGQHKGYGTKLHHRLLRRLGPSEIHRKSFAPVRVLL